MISEWPIHALQTWEGKSLPALNRPPPPISDNHSVGNKLHGKVPQIRKSEPCPNFLVMNAPKRPSLGFVAGASNPFRATSSPAGLASMSGVYSGVSPGLVPSSFGATSPADAQPDCHEASEWRLATGSRVRPSGCLPALRWLSKLCGGGLEAAS